MKNLLIVVLVLLGVQTFAQYGDTVICSVVKRKPRPDMLYSNYTMLTPQEFINTAKQYGVAAVFNKNITFTEQINITGKNHIKFPNKTTVKNYVDGLFYYHDAELLMEADLKKTKFFGYDKAVLVKANFSISLFDTSTITVKGFNYTGGSGFSNHNRGGKISLNFEDCNVFTDEIPFVWYSQNGPFVQFKSKNVITKSKRSHNYYKHSNVAGTFENCDMTLLMQDGLQAYAVHDYSGGGVPGLASYLNYINVKARVLQPDGKTYQFAIVEMPNNSGAIGINDSVRISGSEFNAGGPIMPLSIYKSNIGGYVLAYFKECYGSAGPIAGSVFENCKFGAVDFQLLKGDILFKNTTTDWVTSGRGVGPYNVTLDNSSIKNLTLEEKQSGSYPIIQPLFVLKNNSEKPKGVWGFDINTIKFINE